MTTDAAPFRCVLDAWCAHEREVRHYLIGRVHDPALAEDLLQDVFLKALRAGERFCGLQEPRAWLFQVARTTLVDYRRLKKASVPVRESLPSPVLSSAPVDALAACLDRALDALAPDDRDVLRRCDIEGQTQGAYAAGRGLTLPAVKARIQRARVRLREQLVETCGVRFDPEGRVCCHGPGGRGGD